MKILLSSDSSCPQQLAIRLSQWCSPIFWYSAYPFPFLAFIWLINSTRNHILEQGIVQSRKNSISSFRFGMAFPFSGFHKYKMFNIFSTSNSHSLQSKSGIPILYIRLLIKFSTEIFHFILHSKESSCLYRCLLQSLASFQFTLSLTLRVNSSSPQCALS